MSPTDREMRHEAFLAKLRARNMFTGYVNGKMTYSQPTTADEVAPTRLDEPEDEQ